jgi:tight adherence protein B
VIRVARFALPALAAVLLAAVAFPAAAADSSSIQVVDAGTALFPDRSYIMTLSEPRKPPLSSDDVTVTEDGKPVKKLAVLSSASANGIGTVLLIDASNSMKTSIDAAMDAARAFAEQNPGQPLSVVFFNVNPTVALPLTTNSKAVAAILAKPPKLAEGTRAYDALAAAVAQVRGSTLGAARVVLLSDGDDVGSITTLDSAIAQLQSEKVRVYTVGIESPDFDPESLQQIAEKTGGTYASASSPEALRKIYDQLGFQLGNEYLLRYRSTARPGEKVDVQIAVPGAEPVSFAYDTPSAGTSGPYKPAFRDKLLQSWLLVPLIAAAILGLLALALRSLWSLRSNQALVKRLGDFVTLPDEQRAKARRKEVDELLAAVGQQKQRQRNWRWMEGFAEDVDVGQIDRDPTKMIWLSVAAGLLLGVVAGVALGTFWIVLAVVPPVILNLVVRGKARRVRKEFAEQLPENLDVLASALRAGHSLAGAMGVVADEAPEPSKREFSRVVTDEQLGIPLDEALEVTAKRMQNTDVDQLAVLALVQREAGGNTAEVLDQVTRNIRARMDIRRLVTVLTAQGKFSSVVVACVPLGIFLFLMLVNPDHLDPLFHRMIGQVAGIAAIFMTLIGFYVIRRIVSIEL